MPRISQLMLVALALLALAACGSGDEAADPTATPVPTATPMPTPAPSEPLADYPCFNLDAADCDIIVAAGDNAAAMTRFDFDFSLDVSVAGLDPFTLLSSSIPASLTFNAMGEGRLVLDVPDMPLELYTLMQVSGSLDDGDAIQAEVPVTLADDVLYLPLPDADGVTTLTGVPFTAEAVQALELPLDLNNLLSLDTLVDAEVADFGSLIAREQIGAVLNPSGSSVAAFSDFVRLDDAAIDGQAQAVFAYTLDLRALLNSGEFTQAITALTGSVADDPNLGLVLQLLPVVLSQVDAEIRVTQWVGVADGLIHRLLFELDFALDAAALLAFNPSEGAGEAEPITIALRFQVDLQDIDGTQTVAAPADVPVLTTAEVQALFNTVVTDVEAAIEEELEEIERTNATPEAFESDGD